MKKYKKHIMKLSAHLLGLALMMAIAVPGMAQDDVTSTKHNLSVTSGGADPTAGAVLKDYGEVCVYCHTPHGGQTDLPLWNRTNSAATYQMYDSDDIDMTIDGAPSGISLACLSCHDGTIGLDVITNAPNAFEDGGGTVQTVTTSGTNTMPSSSFAFLDDDLRNDHPVSITYDPTADTAFNSIASIQSAGVKLYSGKVQCASCHNPHDETNVPFLRIANTASALCKTCHIK